MIRVRPAMLADVPALVELMTEFYDESDYELDPDWATAAFTTLLSDVSLGAIWIADVDGQPAGHIVLTVRFTMEHGGHSGYIDDLFVRPNYRRQGVAKALLGTLIEECRWRGCLSLHVEVGDDNDAAQALYARHGLAATGDGRVLLSTSLPVSGWAARLH